MNCMMGNSGALVIVPTTILLTVSFFVLLALRKVETQSLKVFGYIVAILLWISAALILAKGLDVPFSRSMMSKGGMDSMNCSMMQGMMKDKGVAGSAKEMPGMK